MNEQSDSPQSPNGNGAPRSGGLAQMLIRLARMLGGRNGDASAREALEELIEEGTEGELPIDHEERALLGNILNLRNRVIKDVMVPRADIVAVEAETSLSGVADIMTGQGHSRLPVYRGSLDDVIGMVHIKDLLAWRGQDEVFSLDKIVRKCLFVAPSMHVLELLLEMRVTRCHLALVVDEYGGIDGLVTIEDLVEEIVGEIEDEHDRNDQPSLIPRPDGTIEADARVTLEEMEKVAGPLFTPEEHEDIDTLGGLVFSLAGRVPIRGELVSHGSGLEFQIVDADPRRIRRLRVRLPPADGGQTDPA